MKYDINQYESAKHKDLIDCICDGCGTDFKREKFNIKITIKRGGDSLYCSNACLGRNSPNNHKTKCPVCNGNKKRTRTYCSTACREIAKPPQLAFETKEISCAGCGALFLKKYQRTKGLPKNSYCSKTCLSDTRKKVRIDREQKFKSIIQSIKPKERIVATKNQAPILGGIKDNCGFCSGEFWRIKRKEVAPKSGKRFCSKSCRMSFYNKNHKIAKSTNKSGPENLVFNLITSTFSSLEITRNNRSALKSGLEIDILIPKIKLAIEINGPVHYMPIYGEDKLSLVMAKDSQKFAETHALGISLLVIDVSTWKTKKSQEEKSLRVFNETIKPLIQEKLNKILAGDSAAESHQGYEPQV